MILKAVRFLSCSNALRWDVFDDALRQRSTFLRLIDWILEYINRVNVK